jgi:hypothetical protein
VIAIGIYYGITQMIVGMIIVSFLSYIINSYYSGRLIQYNTLAQIKDILPSFILASANGVLIYLIGYFMKAPTVVIYITQIFVSIIFIGGLAELFMMKDYLYIKAIVKDKLLKRN